ncbi:hypothetical protein MPTK1_7g13040 [Marchantia polymorpha subsp. ruderalis]|uniref:Uncharacterized protein n=2 Tax=Marchantia polymorpha TaxID=3197 RepID=A0A176WNF0_MARPO|nr:hypothetical protein AXG93_4875s1030 [Marchantia polymorpha subsp. ruderalis]PTQ49483.1 hypothetical protein MARPO_0003s0312 [Marchantia polymorpha]BBN17248.1 hypothetical protein Mp_7g13040 [Marchantia polymorpha subsp. ruderalis]|eukprot:PTQ49483.1 hypothetical protein MARPO_0003s0312 [Marchantia polymorpha]
MASQILPMVAAVILVSQSLWAQQALAQAEEPLVPALIIIGDSTVDVGNNNGLVTVIKSNFGPYGRDFSAGPTGRFCNGKIIPDYVAEFIGIPYPMAYLDPAAKGSAILTGINTASSASGFYEGTAKNFNVIPLSQQMVWIKDWQRQVTDQVGPARAATIFEEGIFVVSTGSNDYVNNYYLNILLQEKYNQDQYRTLLLDCTIGLLKEMYATGAKRIAVVGMPPLGCLPSQIKLRLGTNKCVDSLNQNAIDFNAALKVEVDKMMPSMPDAKIVLLDSYSYIYDAFHNPAKYGLKKTSEACCGTGTVEVAILCNEASPGTCQNADEYLFWDSFHPSSKFNAGIARYFFDTAVKAFGLVRKQK